MLQIDLKSHLSNPGSGDEASLVEKLEYIMKQQVRKTLKVLCSYISSSFPPYLLRFLQFSYFCC